MPAKDADKKKEAKMMEITFTFIKIKT